MQAQNIYEKKEGISSRKLGNDLMLYDRENDKVHVLNETGALIWELINGKSNLPDIENVFLQKFTGVKKDEISKDIREIINKLLSEGLITCC